MPGAQFFTSISETVTGSICGSDPIDEVILVSTMIF
jgi:hypothetical protein